MYDTIAALLLAVWIVGAVWGWRRPWTGTASVWMPRATESVLPLLLVMALSDNLPDATAHWVQSAAVALMYLMIIRNVSHGAWPLPARTASPGDGA